jgi:hypothetical protein
MAYTNKALAVVWLCALVLFALSATGTVDGRGVLLLVLAAFAMPAIILTIFPRPALLLASLASPIATALTPPPVRLRMVPKPSSENLPSARTAVGVADLPGTPAKTPAIEPMVVSSEAPTAFRVRAIVRQGTAASLPAVWERYATLDDARDVVRSMYASDRVLRVSIVTSDVPPRFVEWVER